MHSTLVVGVLYLSCLFSKPVRLRLAFLGAKNSSFVRKTCCICPFTHCELWLTVVITVCGRMCEWVS